MTARDPRHTDAETIAALCLRAFIIGAVLGGAIVAIVAGVI